ncbi:MAG TPA: nuclear transport factor 2 family protein [Devosiaceae bacterium]
MDAKAPDFEQFMKRREAAAEDYVCGRPDGVSHLSTHHSPATFYGPDGGIESGAAHVDKSYRDGATHFEDGSESSFEILHMAADDNVGYWTGVQHAKVKMHGKKDKVAMDLRVTELFRREGSDWKLIHRHADMLKADHDHRGA